MGWLFFCSVLGCNAFLNSFSLTQCPASLLLRSVQRDSQEKEDKAFFNCMSHCNCRKNIYNEHVHFNQAFVTFLSLTVFECNRCKKQTRQLPCSNDHKRHILVHCPACCFCFNCCVKMLFHSFIHSFMTSTLHSLSRPVAGSTSTQSGKLKWSGCGPSYQKCLSPTREYPLSRIRDACFCRIRAGTSRKRKTEKMHGPGKGQRDVSKPCKWTMNERDGCLQSGVRRGPEDGWLPVGTHHAETSRRRHLRLGTRHSRQSSATTSDIRLQRYPELPYQHR